MSIPGVAKEVQLPNCPFCQRNVAPEATRAQSATLSAIVKGDDPLTRAPLDSKPAAVPSLYPKLHDETSTAGEGGIQG